MSTTTQVSTTFLVLVPAIAALLGAFIGSMATVLSAWLRERHEARRKHAELVVQSASHEYDKAFIALREAGIEVPPFSSFLAYYDGVLRLLQNADPITPEALEEISRRTDMFAFFEVRKVD